MYDFTTTTKYAERKQNTSFVLAGLVSLSAIILFLIFTSVTYAATTIGTTNTAIVPNGLVGHWTFDGKDMTNTTALDKSGQGNTGTLTNMTAWSGASIGKSGQALRFDSLAGVGDDYVEIGSSIKVDNSTQGSISAWIRYNSMGSVSYIFSYGGGSVTNPGLFNFRLINVSGSKYLQLLQRSNGEGTFNQLIGSTALVSGRWYHVAAVSSGSTIKLYVDGVEEIITVQAGANNGNWLGDTTVTEPDHTIIGSRYYFGTYATEYLFDGAIDDFRIYNRAITPTEIQTLYKAGGGVVTATAPTPPSAFGLTRGLVGHWTFDGKDMTNATATDLSGTGNHGALINMTTASSKAIGKIGQALTFDNSNDYINVGRPSNLNLTGAMTVSAWINPRSFGETDRGRIFDKNDYIFLLDNNTYTNTFALGRSGSYGSALHAAPNNSVVLNTWQQIAAVHDGTYISFYKNGVKISGPTLHDSPLAGANDFLIGGNAATDRVFDGRIDDARIYNRALSDNEMLALYKLGQTVTAVSPTNNSGTGINSGLLTHWNFDGKNMTNTTVLDSSGNGLTGTLTNMTTRGSAAVGKMGQALNFRTNNYINAGDVLDFNYTDARTISAWVKPTTLEATVNLTNTIISKQRISSQFDGWGLALTDSGKVRFEYIQNLGSLFITKTDNIVVSAGKWSHVAYVYNNISGLTYVNGVLVASTVTSNTLVGSADNAVSLNIGNRDNDTGSGTRYDGIIDDVRIYNRAFSASEIQSLYKLGQ